MNMNPFLNSNIVNPEAEAKFSEARKVVAELFGFDAVGGQLISKNNALETEKNLEKSRSELSSAALSAKLPPVDKGSLRAVVPPPRFSNNI